MHKQCSTFKNVLNLRYLFFVMYLIFPKIKVMIIFKHLFVISIPSKTLATSSQYVRKLAIFALLIEGRGITMLLHTYLCNIVTVFALVPLELQSLVPSQPMKILLLQEQDSRSFLGNPQQHITIHCHCCSVYYCLLKKSVNLLLSTRLRYIALLSSGASLYEGQSKS